MTNLKLVLSGLFLGALMLNSLSAVADQAQKCDLKGNSYGYVYNGTSYSQGAPVPLTETGVFSVDGDNGLTGDGTLALYYSDFFGNGPLWLLVHEVQSNGVVAPSLDDPCSGTVDVLSTTTVIKTSNANLVPVGVVLFTDSPRSLAYTLSGKKYEVVDMISTSPGTIASGTAHKRGGE